MRARKRWVSVLAVLLFLAAWEGVCRGGFASPVLLSPPSRIALVAARLLGSGALNEDAVFTFGVFGAGLGLSLVLGLAAGLAMGFSAATRAALQPFVVTASALPKIVLMPLIGLWLGIGVSANLALALLMGGFPIIMSVDAGVRGLDRDLLLLARAFGAGPWLTLSRVVLPGLMPAILGGLRVAVSTTMVGALIAEFFGSSRGLGYRMVLTAANFQVDEFFVCLVVVAGFTLAIQSAVHLLERRFEGWRPALAPGGAA